MTSENGSLRIYLFITIIVVLTTICYLDLPSLEFIRYDDLDYVVNNPQVHLGLTPVSFRWAFFSTEHSNWHPLTWLSHMLDYKLYGLNPAGHHVTNLLLHLCNSILLFQLLRSATKADWQSAMVALLFGIHPLHVESIAWVAERKDVLYTFFWLAALLAYCRYTAKPGLWCYCWVAVLFACSLLAKPMAVTLPLVMLLLDWWPLHRNAAQSVGSITLLTRNCTTSRLFLEKIPFFAMAGATAYITVFAQKHGGSVSQPNIDVIQFHLGNVPLSYLTYIGKTFWPTDLAIFYPINLESVTVATVTYSMSVMLTITVLLFWFRKQHPWLLSGWLWFLITLLPVIGVLKAGAQSVADRYTYVPSIGLFIAVVWCFTELANRWRYGRQALLLVSIAILVIMLLLCRKQVTYWRTTETVFRHALSVTRDNWVAHNILGVVRYQEGDLVGAIHHYREALRINPLHASSWNNLGNCYRQTGDLSEAEAALREAIRLDNRYAAPLHNLGLLYAVRGDNESAEDMYNRLRGIDLSKAEQLLLDIRRMQSTNLHK